MRASRSLLAACVGSVLLGVLLSGPVAGQDYASVLLKGHAAHPTRLLARVRTGARVAAHASALAANGLRAVGGFALVPGLVVLDLDPKAGTMAAAAASGSNADVVAAQLQVRLAALRATGLFEYVEPDYFVTIDAIPTDSAFADGTLWGLRNSGQDGGVAGVDVDAVRAWDVTTGSNDVVVAVIDSGIDYTHPDLAAQMWRNPGEIAGNGLDDDANGYIDDVHGIDAITGTGDPMDDNNHGTHCSGTIGAAANDGHPHVGIAWHVRLMACKFLDQTGRGLTSHAIASVDYAVEHGAKILSNSWGGDGYSQSLADAIQAAGRRGVLFVAAAGNAGKNTDGLPNYPSGYDLDTIVSVAAIDRSGARAGFSNFGMDSVDLGAPGVSIYSTVIGGYDTYDGTSMATPHVAGVAALVRAQFPDIPVGDLRDRLLHTTTSTPSLQGNTGSGGRVNAYDALTAGGDGKLEIAMSPRTGTVLAAGRRTSVVVRVTDLVGVPGATVTGTAGGAALLFRDDGVAPDNVANDSNHTATLDVPATGTVLAWSVVASAAGKVGASENLNYTLQIPPRNDQFADRIPLAFAYGSTTANNFGATLERGEPILAGESGGASLWWTWIAPEDSNVLVSTEGSPFDTMLGVFTGTSVSALTELGSNDDIDGSNQPSRILFRAVAGTAYQIVVDGWNGKTGDITLTLTGAHPPANDNFANRLRLEGIAVSVAANTRLASWEAGESRFPDWSEFASVWWTWTAPFNGTARVSSVGVLDWATFPVTVYTGESLAALASVPLRAGERDALYPDWNHATFAARAGTTYQISVAGGTGARIRDFTLNLVVSPEPANDSFANRLVLTGAPTAAQADNRNATREPGESLYAGDAEGASLWWEWTAPMTRPYAITATGDGFHTLLNVYTGSTTDTLRLVASSLDAPAREITSLVTFQATSGVSYVILVDTRGRQPGGNISVNITPIDRAPTVPLSPFIFTTLAGSPGNSGRADGTGSEARFNSPYGIAVDSLGNVFVADTGNSTIRKIARDGTVTTFAGRAGVQGSADGVGSNARFTFPSGVAVDGGSNVLVADGGSVRKITPAGAVSTLAKGFVSLWDLAVDEAGNAYVIDSSWDDWGDLLYSRLNKITPDGVVFVVLDGVSGRGLALDPAGNIYVAGGETGEVIRFSTGLSRTTATTGFSDPFDVAIDVAGNLFVVDGGYTGTGNWRTDSIVMTDAAGVWAKAMGRYGKGDGLSQNVGFDIPASVAIDAAGNLYVADSANHTIRKGVPVRAASSAPPSRLVNASVRANLLAGERLIPGFVMSGGAKPVLVRVIGPGLAPFVPGGATLAADARLELRDAVGALVDSNDDWGGGAILRDAFATVGAFPLPDASADAALLHTINGPYTAHVLTTVNGVGLVELYDAGGAIGPRLVNFSARYAVGGGAGALILGFVIEGTGEKTVLIRGIGPALAAAPFNVADALVDPKLEIFNAAGQRFAESDNWSVSLASLGTQVNAFALPVGSKDAAVLLTLPPGLYTAVLSGAGGGTGEGLIEVYEVQ